MAKRIDAWISLGRPYLCALILLGAASTGCRRTLSDSESSGVNPSLTVKVQAAENRAIRSVVTALGRCEALPDKLAALTPLVEGQVALLPVKQGDRVAAGQIIVQLDVTLAQADMAEKEAARDSLVASLKLLESLPRVTEQQAGKLAIEQANVAVGRAAAQVERLQPLKSQNEVSDAQMFEAEQALKQAQLQQETAQAQFDVLMLRPRDEAIEEAKAQIKVADEAVKSSQARLDFYALRAPIEGVLDSLNCRPGQTVAIGSAIGEIVDNRQALAAVWLPVDRSQRVRVGQPAHIRVAGSSGPTEAGKATKTIDGEVVFVGQIADAQTGNVPVRILVDNSQNELVIGETLHADIVVDQSGSTLAVPISSVHDEGEGPVVTVVRENKTVVLHPGLGQSDVGWIAITGTDLNAGEPVVVEGAYNLPVGTLVKMEVVGNGAQALGDEGSRSAAPIGKE